MPEILTLRHFVMTAAQFRPVSCVQYGYKPLQDEVEWDFYFCSFEIFGHKDASSKTSTQRQVLEKPEIYPKQVFLPYPGERLCEIESLHLRVTARLAGRSRRRHSYLRGRPCGRLQRGKGLKINISIFIRIDICIYIHACTTVSSFVSTRVCVCASTCASK